MTSSKSATGSSGRGALSPSRRSTPQRTLGVPPTGRGAGGPSGARTGAHRPLRRAHVEMDPRDPFGVQAFRREVLADRLVKNLKEWIDAARRRQGRPTIIRGRVSLLAIRLDDAIVRRATRRGRPLERLRQVSDTWPRSAAGNPPMPRPTSSPLHRLTSARSRPRAAQVSPAGTRPKVVLTIDPPQHQRRWRRRRSITGAAIRTYPPPRSKHAQLAVFAFQHQALPIDEQLATWNGSGRRRDHRYRFRSVFKREADMAFRSLVDLRPRRAGN